MDSNFEVINEIIIIEILVELSNNHRKCREEVGLILQSHHSGVPQPGPETLLCVLEAALLACTTA